jgi:hypothetical protein
MSRKIGFSLNARKISELHADECFLIKNTDLLISKKSATFASENNLTI